MTDQEMEIFESKSSDYVKKFILVMVSMFAFILIFGFIVGDKEISDFNFVENSMFIVLILVEIILTLIMFYYGMRFGMSLGKLNILRNLPIEVRRLIDVNDKPEKFYGVEAVWFSQDRTKRALVNSIFGKYQLIIEVYDDKSKRWKSHSKAKKFSSMEDIKLTLAQNHEFSV